MTIKEQIKNECGVDLPISGGFGNSIDDAIIIHRTGINDYVGTERFILNCLGESKNFEWKLLIQMLLDHEDKTIDKIEIETITPTEHGIITKVENFYFDITDCFGKEMKQMINSMKTLFKNFKKDIYK